MINGSRPGCSWESNPWVWALTFKIVTAEQSATQVPANKSTEGLDQSKDSSPIGNEK